MATAGPEPVATGTEPQREGTSPELPAEKLLSFPAAMAQHRPGPHRIHREHPMGKQRQGRGAGGRQRRHPRADPGALRPQPPGHGSPPGAGAAEEAEGTAWPQGGARWKPLERGVGTPGAINNNYHLLMGTAGINQASSGEWFQHSLPGSSRRRG
ncbi:break repair meiotic recombinase recruitment factor 1 isoform X1 [Onychostruthus taczanowskii]|uniref:break repair meiotic recombinase recruitment factor 1 isoform X1 n=1 Tax=Onychostruthus taczanowskii TaxID=356909 RepID=UPI001B80C005|nr:break repair meiotic recombinase recruitment factor 1 isoform X1 [Onychostruthus taczanowskii]